MSIINSDQPVWADFNNRDKDGAVWLGKTLTDMRLKDMDLLPTEDREILVSDGEVEMIGIIKSRDGGWVAVPDANGFRDVRKDAWYHNDNNPPQPAP